MANKATTISPIKDYKHGVKFITVTFLADDADATVDTAVLYGLEGMQLHSVAISNGATGLTATSDLQLNDGVSGFDLIAAATKGLDIGGNSTNVFRLAEDATHMIHGPLTATITNNAANAGTATMSFAFITISDAF